MLLFSIDCNMSVPDVMNKESWVASNRNCCLGPTDYPLPCNIHHCQQLETNFGPCIKLDRIRLGKMLHCTWWWLIIFDQPKIKPSTSSASHLVGIARCATFPAHPSGNWCRATDNPKLSPQEKSGGPHLLSGRIFQTQKTSKNHDHPKYFSIYFNAFQNISIKNSPKLRFSVSPLP